MRVAMIGSRGIGSNYGGVERVLDELCPRLRDLGHRIDVYARSDCDTVPPEGIGSIPTPSLGGKHLDNLSRSAIALSRSIGKYDLIHFHAIGPGILSAITRIAGQPSLVTVHALDHRRDKWGRMARACIGVAEHALVASADRISVVSEGLRRYFVERYDTYAEFVPNGQPFKQRVPAGALLAEQALTPGRYVLFASRLVPEKGCHDLIDTFNRLGTDWKLVVAGASGSPSYIEQLRALADPRRVIFVGHRAGLELAELFSNAALFVLPSYIEGMSMALLEAVAFGIPSLVSDIAENRAVVGRFAAYFKPHDLDALAAILGRLIASPEELAGMAQRLAELHLPDWEYAANRYDRLYRAAVEPRRAGLMLSPRSG